MRDATPPTIRTVVRGARWLLGALVVLAGAACAGDDPEPAASPGTSTPTTVARAPTPIQPGRYTYAVQGALSSNLLPAQRLVPTATLVVEALTSSDQRQVLTFGEVVVEQVVRYANDGVYLVSMKANEAGGGEEYRPAEPVLTAPSGAGVGRTWSWQVPSTDGDSTMKVDYKVASTELRKVGNESIGTSVVEAITVVTGADGIITSRQTLWTSERHGGLPIRITEVTQGSNRGLDIRLEGTFDLVSTAPA